jgi:GDP-D-mannose dehydratase
LIMILPLYDQARDPSKAAQVLHWSSTVKLPEIVARMVRAESLSSLIGF